MSDTPSHPQAADADGWLERRRAAKEESEFPDEVRDQDTRSCYTDDLRYTVDLSPSYTVDLSLDIALPWHQPQP